MIFITFSRIKVEILKTRVHIDFVIYFCSEIKNTQMFHEKRSHPELILKSVYYFAIVLLVCCSNLNSCTDPLNLFVNFGMF